MTKFLLSPAAADDVREIAEYIAKESPPRARRVLNEIEESMELLARRPGLGHMRDDLADERLRAFLIYSYVVIYRPETRPLEIIRILHGARDVASLLRRPL